MPNFSLIPELCKILNITINDLFSGEVVDMKNNEKKLEENLLEMTKLKQEKDKQLLNLEIFILILACIIIFLCIFVSSFVEMDEIYRILLIVFGFVQFIVGWTYCLKIEQIAGYYECKKCKHKYVPTFIRVFVSAHVGRTRYMRCPKCNKYSWKKKVLSKGESCD